MCGMCPEVTENVFEKIFQVSGTSALMHNLKKVTMTFEISAFIHSLKGSCLRFFERNQIEL